MFDENGDRKGLTQIEQLQGHREVMVGVYDPSSFDKNKIVWTEDIIWTGKVKLNTYLLSGVWQNFCFPHPFNGFARLN